MAPGRAPGAGRGLGLRPGAGRVAAARRNYPEITFHRANAERLDFPDAAFELVLVFTVFSSILDPGMEETRGRRNSARLRPRRRRLGRFTPRLYPALSRVPFLRTHYLGVLGKEEG